MQEAGRRKETRGTDSTAYFYLHQRLGETQQAAEFHLRGQGLLIWVSGRRPTASGQQTGDKACGVSPALATVGWLTSPRSSVAPSPKQDRRLQTDNTGAGWSPGFSRALNTQGHFWNSNLVQQQEVNMN